MADDFELQTKTEPPSPRRRERAAEEGQFAFSSELNTGVVLFVGTLGLLGLAHTLGGGLLDQTRFDLSLLPPAELTTGAVQQLFIAKFNQALASAGILIGLLFVATLVVGVAQVGFNFNFTRLAINWERVMPFHGGRIFSANNVMRGVFLLCKIAAIAVVAWWILRQRGDEISQLNGASLAGSMTSAWHLIIRIALGLAGTLLVIGVADYAFQRWRFEQTLYMSRQELKEEHKREEGNPQTKARIRKLQRENAQRKMFHQVQRATVVVTNPTHLAVALQYESGAMAAPKVVAKGADHVAKRIVMIARAHGVPVVERKSLAQALYKTVKLDQAIPFGLYVVIAELMAYVYRLKGHTAKPQ
jgi:flagellar biosynthesis protein FlhB